MEQIPGACLALSHSEVATKQLSVLRVLGRGDGCITCSRSRAPFVTSAGRQDHRSFRMNGALSSYNSYELIKLFPITYMI